MQTFLPYPDFARSARVLDTRRLGKQRVEALQIMRAMHVDGHGWRHHPAVRMWRGHEEALAAYGLAICKEWSRRGYADTCAGKIAAELREMHGSDRVRSQSELRRLGLLPAWLGQRRLHQSHRSALLRKAPEWYGGVFKTTPSHLEYVWPNPVEREPGYGRLRPKS